MLFYVLLFSAVVTLAQIVFPQILRLVYPRTFSTDVSCFWFFLPEFHCWLILHRLIYISFWLRSSSSVDCLVVGINCFDTGVELDCVLACFGGKVVEMRGFFVGKISFVTVLGCDRSRYGLMVAVVDWVL